MSKVLSAKRQEVTATYEFLDGTETKITIVSLSTKEGKALALFSKDETTTGAEFMESVAKYHLQRNDQNIIDRILKEQDEEGNIIDFVSIITQAIEDERKGKSQD